MSLKAQLHREKLRKRLRQGMRGYPAATIAYYGPDNQRASKVVIGLVKAAGNDVDVLERLHLANGDVRFDVPTIDAIVELLGRHGVKSVIGLDRIIGCPHEEGIDYPDGEPCPQCPYWAGRDRFAG
jgi:hypothetical protein